MGRGAEQLLYGAHVASHRPSRNPSPSEIFKRIQSFYLDDQRGLNDEKNWISFVTVGANEKLTGVYAGTLVLETLASRRSFTVRAKPNRWIASSSVRLLGLTENEASGKLAGVIRELTAERGLGTVEGLKLTEVEAELACRGLEIP